MKMKKIFVLALFAFSFILSNNSTLAQTTDSVTLRQLTVSEREKYEVLLREYGTLKQQLAELEARGSSWCHTFNTNLSIGMTGSEVTALQTALTKAGFTISATGNFDEVTAAAVSGFQLKYQSEILTPLGLTNPTGYFGPATRAVMNRLYGCGNQSPTTPSITVSSPTNNSSWTSTNGPVVQWSSQNIPASNTVTIQLLTPSGGSVPGFSNFTTANDGSESGRLANSTVASGWYYFRLSTLVNGQTVYGGSGAFQFTGASQTPLSTATTYSVTVGVKNVNTGVWIAGAAVRVTGNGLDRTLTTASNGQTSTEVPAGAYTLMVSAAGYQTQTQSITIVSSGYNWQPSLTPTAVTTTLTVTSPTSGSYAAGASLPVTWTWANIPSGTLVNVYLLDSNNSPNVGASGLVNTANDGSATLTLRSDAPAGRYRVRVAATVNGQLITGYGNWFSVTNSVVTPPPVTTYTLSRQINPIGAGSTIRDPNMTNYPAGTVVTITATPAAGYAFSHWGIDLSGSVNPTTITMNGNKTVSANFAVTPTTAAMRIRVKDSSTLAYLANANVTFRVDGAVIAYQTTDANGLTGSVDVAIGKSLYLDVSHTGYTPRTNYNSGTVPSSGGVRDALLTATPATTAAMRIRVKDSSTLAYLANANVTFRVDGAVIAYQTTDANGLTGSVDVAIGKSLYLDVSHTGYTPRTNYNSGTVPSSGGVRDALLTAAPATTYTLTTWIDPAGSGAISKSPNQSSFNSGAQVTLTATPAAGYAFSSWSGNCLGTNSTCILTMNANKSAYAHFTPAPATTAYTYTLTTSVMAGSGSITKNPNKTNYSAGDVVTLTANPGTGYALDFWRDDCSFINDPPPSNTCTLTINANKSVTAYFGFTLSVTKAGLGSGRSSVTSGAGINCDSNESDCLEVITPNASPSLTATPVGGYSFANWSGDISGTTNPRAITMNNAKSVTANFTGNPLHTVGIIVKKNNCTTNCYISGAAVSIEYFTPPLTDGNTISLGTTGTDGKSSTTGLREGMDWKVKAIKTGYNNYNNTTRYSVSSGTPNPYWLIILMTPS